jgi:rhamnose utilization protein RhaD (predicted bifunctional aldolase and dehydrogenase)/NAD(P)-dependent dehydrogenase (short-subunit alcohol dehydrogenase family)
MQGLWSERDAQAMTRAYAKQGVGEDVALCVYGTRLLGNEPRLVQHGGGNTSVKTRLKDVTGAAVDVLCVKGSGWDMGSIEPPGLPAVRLDALLRLAALEKLGDEDMVNAQRGALIDSAAPNPSVETLLHAFMPHKFIDHTHANAVLALTDHADGQALCAEIYGGRVALAPYLMPGFGLAKLARRVYAENPACEGMVLLKHGIFSFGDTARQAYERMIEFVTLAEERVKRATRKSAPAKKAPARPAAKLAPLAEVAPILRGLLAQPLAADGAWKRMLFAHRHNERIAAFIGGAGVARYSQAGVVTPDHVIRTKAKPLLLPPPLAGKLDEFRAAAQAAVERYAADYRAYFARNNALQQPPKKPLDPLPRVLLVPGVGLFGVGGSVKDAAIAADIAETAIAVIADAEALGPFESISERDIFDVEYWSLEQAKLGKGAEKPLARQVVAVTGGAGAIGAATARAFAAAGAAVAVLDLDGRQAEAVAQELGGIGLACDVTDRAAVDGALNRIAESFGGVDIVVSNAGAAWTGKIGAVDDAVLRQSFELNFFSHQYVAQAAVRIMLAQGTGGCLLFNTSKQAVNPGPDFGPYGIPKAATLFLSRQYAIDYGAAGIRSNAVNADRIRSGLLTDAMIAKRSKARGLSEKEYLAGNLLGREVTANDVARAFVDLALAEKTTAAVLTVDGGNIAAALR